MVKYCSQKNTSPRLTRGPTGGFSFNSGWVSGGDDTKTSERRAGDIGDEMKPVGHVVADMEIRILQNEPDFPLLYTNSVLVCNQSYCQALKKQ